MTAMDPYAVLGLHPDATVAERTAAYRRLAKRHHPDRAGGAAAAARMAEINAAYDTLRAAARPQARPPERPEPPAPRRVRSTGAWLPEIVRRALGRELLAALEEGEDVALVTPTSTWASPQALLAVTDRRLLWLLDDAITQRVRYVRFGAIAAIEHRLRRPLRRAAVLRVRTTEGRRLDFAELRPQTAALIERHVEAARQAA
jgi:DnaJ domain